MYYRIFISLISILLLISILFPLSRVYNRLSRSTPEPVPEPLK